jgi:carbamoyl-phosphate synthase large subunit
VNILVSGVAGDIGFGVARILRGNIWNGKIYGMDTQLDHAGGFMCDYITTSPRADDEGYLNWLSNYITQNNIKVFIPTSEAEISRIVLEQVDKIANAIVIKSNDLVVKKCLDKHECLSYLLSCGVSVPEHGLLSEEKPNAYPVIVKPKSGQGSKGILKVFSEEQLPIFQTENLVWQSYLEPDDEEYTCPVFRSAKTGTRILIIKRTLQGGFTNIGEVINNEEIEKYVDSIANVLELDGVMNIQLRLTKQGPRLFEINPRLSSTLVFRDKLGFCDLSWLLYLRLDLPIANYTPPTTGTRFYRGVQEYISLK